MTMTVGGRGVDFSGLRMSGAQLALDGVQFACRYLSPPASVAPNAQWKIIQKAEFDDLRTYLGVDGLYLNWEWYAGRCLEGAAAGAQDGAWAYAAARALGYEQGRYIIISHDTSARNDLQVAAYIRAFAAQQAGYYRVDAVYSGIDTVQAMRNLGLASFIWQTLAWSRGLISQYANFYQNGRQWYNGQADENVIITLPTAGPAPTPPAPAGVPAWPLPPGQYFGLVTGPNESRGGARSDPQWVNDDIQHLQTILVQNGWAGTHDLGWADGVYQQPTVAAVLNFQRAKGLPQTGNIGPADWNMLYTNPGGGAVTPVTPVTAPAWPSWMKPGNYFGLISGSSVSHGGINDQERGAVRLIQQKLVALGYAGRVGPGWADGKFEQPTFDAVKRFQQAHMPGTTFYGQVWSDDWRKLFSL